MRHKLLFAAALLAPAPAVAAERVLTLTGYDRVRVEGPYRVEITSNRGSGGRIIGEREAIDRVTVQTIGRTLIIRPRRFDWNGGWPGEDRSGPVIIRLTTGDLRALSVSGSGTAVLDRARGANIDLALNGSGAISVGMVDADQLSASVTGSGAMTLAGTARAATIRVSGSAGLDAAGLIAQDLRLNAQSSGNVVIATRGPARVVARGAGNVEVSGKGSCDVDATGSGTVKCGR